MIGDEKCTTPHLYEKDLQRVFLDYVNSLITDRAAMTRGLKEALMAIAVNAALERERDALQDEYEIVMELMRKMVQETSGTRKTGQTARQSTAACQTGYEKAGKRLAEVNKDIAMRNAQRSEMEIFQKLLDCREQLLTEFDEALWLGIVHQVKLHSDNEFAFMLKDGSELLWNFV